MSAVLPPPALHGAATTTDIEKSEVPIVDNEPFLPDQKYHKTSPPELLTLTGEQEAVYQEVLKHFVAEEYVIPDVKEGSGGLTEEERFYLVSLSFGPL